MTDRRTFLTAALVAPVAIAAPAAAWTFSCSLDPVDRYYSATDAYNGNAIGMTDEEYTQVVEDLDAWAPPTQRDFLRKFIAQYGDGGTPSADYRMQMVEQAKRLLA